MASGDAIVGSSSETGGGQPTAPVTVTAGLEYKFSVCAHRSFVRADVEYEGRAKWLTASQDPNVLQYDPANVVLAWTTFTSLRGGMDLGAWSVSAFVDNLTRPCRARALRRTVTGWSALTRSARERSV